MSTHIEINFRLTESDDGKIKVDVATNPEGAGLVSPWSHFGDYDTIDKAAEECGAEVLYQFQREQELDAKVENDPLSQMIAGEASS